MTKILEKGTLTHSTLFSLIIGVLISVPTYKSSAPIFEFGFSWKEVLSIIFLSNLIIIAPTWALAKLGINKRKSFPSLLHENFGESNSKILSLLRVLMCAISSGASLWVASQILQLTFEDLSTFHPSVLSKQRLIGDLPLPTFFELGFYLVAIIATWNIGRMSIKKIGKFSILTSSILAGGCLLIFLITKMRTESLGPLFRAVLPLQPHVTISPWLPILASSSVWQHFLPAVPDYSKSLKMNGNKVALFLLLIPVLTTLFSLLAIGCSSIVLEVYGVEVWDPLTLLGQSSSLLIAVSGKVSILLSLLLLNILGNLAGGINALRHLAPQASLNTIYLTFFILSLIILPTATLASWNVAALQFMYFLSCIMAASIGVIIADLNFLNSSEKFKLGYQVKVRQKISISCLIISLFPAAFNFLGSITQDLPPDSRLKDLTALELNFWWLSLALGFMLPLIAHIPVVFKQRNIFR